jgi:hypothetical protein
MPKYTGGKKQSLLKNLKLSTSGYASQQCTTQQFVFISSAKVVITIHTSFFQSPLSPISNPIFIPDVYNPRPTAFR